MFRVQVNSPCPSRGIIDTCFMRLDFLPLIKDAVLSGALAVP